MLYNFMELPDGTIISHYDMIDGNVKVYMETPDEKYCFKHATCWLPEKNGKIFTDIQIKNSHI